MNESTKQSLLKLCSSELSTNLFNQIHSFMFVKDSKTVILMKEGHQQGAEQQKENKIQ
jgi:hypothetical protein